MAVVRDPAFWKRFSMAVHLDEEKGTISDARSTSSLDPKSGVKHSDTWLERNRKKQRQTRILGWVITFGFLIIIAAIILIVLWFLKVGPFKEKSD
ncbi:uncharacterized protein A1O9_06697 [Exophiala aquamarina CBS 119918]|uniref:Uncharacterized protein n=1 Tax=Exophiala aquamarina CBS 119918 TaxID=1182545 RepID=A0A072PLT9_9EURO|nr:uncharacterized protein A1O9_06697 [Exophiala aquamarina CBS 119918]KEF56510.1 hypothetical protein A1O9_06697 [Exophiala aquamarina CBS 119918]